MSIFQKIRSAFIIYPVSILGFLGSVGAEAIGLLYIYTSVRYKDYGDFLLGGGLIILGIILGDFSFRVFKDEKKTYNKISEEVEIKGFTKNLLRHVDKSLLETISKEKNKEEEFKYCLGQKHKQNR